MAERPITPDRPPVAASLVGIDPRSTSLAYAVLAGALLVYYLSATPPTTSLDRPLINLLVLLITAPINGALLAARDLYLRGGAIALMLLTFALVIDLVARTGGVVSAYWLALSIPLMSAVSLLPGITGIGVATAFWLAYGSVLLALANGPILPIAATWLLRGSALGLFGVVLGRAVSTQRTLVRRARERERSMRRFLESSNRMRASSHVQDILTEVANVVQSAGDFDNVALVHVDWRSATAQVVVALGASGRRLQAVEKIQFPWSELEELMERGEPIGAHARLVVRLPYRSLPNEWHLLLPIISQFDEIVGLLTVTASRRERATLEEALPLLELLANQAATALDNASLFTTMEQRVQQVTADLERGADDLRRARDRAEVLYRIARGLSESLDERRVLEQALELVAASTGAERGGIMLVEPNSGRLVFRSALGPSRAERAGIERGQGLAGWVLANRAIAIVPDTTSDTRWQIRSPYDNQSRSALAVPLLLEQEALGVLILIHSTPNHFNADHAQLAIAAAGQAAVALSKAQLYRYVSEQSERLGMIAQQREEEASKNLAILRSIADGVVAGDRLGRIRMINPAAERILGVSAEQLIGRPLSDLPGAPRDETQSQMEKFPIGELTVRAHAAPVYSPGGEWLGSVVVYHDLTREEQADRLKSRLVATASHELRTPMTSILGYVDMMRLGTFGAISDSHREPLRVIRSNVTRLVALIEDLLDMSRAEAGELKLRPERVDMAEIISGVTADLSNQFTSRQVSVALDLPDDPAPVFADRAAMTQIAFNLIGNACKYTPGGGHVDISLRNGGGVVRVDVRDNGVGITAEAQTHIFTPFYRADNPLRDEVGGTGLGLSITRRLIELHGGKIWFESNEGAGTTFSFTLPVGEEKLG